MQIPTYIFLLMMFAETGEMIVKPEPMPDAIECLMRVDRERSTKRSIATVAVCVPPGAAVTVESAKAGS